MQDDIRPCEIIGCNGSGPGGICDACLPGAIAETGAKPWRVRACRTQSSQFGARAGYCKREGTPSGFEEFATEAEAKARADELNARRIPNCHYWAELPAEANA